jgi:spore germination protein
MHMEMISNRQLVLIGASYVMNAALLCTMIKVMEAGYNDSWMAVPLALIVSFSAVWLLLAAARRFPGQDLFEVLAARHPVIGRAFGFLYIFYFFILLCRDFRMLILFIHITLLEFTPLLVLAMLILVCAVYMARGGLEVSARVNEMWMFLFVLSVVLVPILVAPDLRMHHLFPMLYNGFVPVLKSSWFLFPFFGEIIILPFLMGYPTFNLKSGMQGLLIGSAGIFILLACSLLVLGANVATRFTFPPYELVRLIQLTDFLDRLELPLVAVWMPTLIAKIAIGMHLASHGLGKMIPAMSPRELTLPFGALAVACSFWLFRDLSELLLFNRLWPFAAILFQLVIPLLFALFLRPARNR